MPSTADRRKVEREEHRRRRRRPTSGGNGQGPGVAVDASGGPAIDPTENVRELFEAGSTRQDDLRLSERRLQEEKILRIETELRAVTREVEIRANHQKDLDTLEAKRLDAVRSVDQLAVKTEADRAAAAVSALATQAATTAETLRSAVIASATNLATQLDRTVTALTERIAALEKSSYTGQGKQAVQDPQVTELLMETRALRVAQSVDHGADHGRKDTQENLKSVLQVGIAAILLMIALATFMLKTNAPTTPPGAAPQVIYVPAPAGALLPTTPPQAAPR